MKLKSVERIKRFEVGIICLGKQAALRERVNSAPIILLGDESDAALRERVMTLAPGAQIVAPGADLERAQVIYGGVQPKDIGAARALRWLQLSSAGANRWPLAELGARDITVTTVSGIHAQPITEHMFGMLLMNTRALDCALQRQPLHQWRGFDYGARVQRIADKTLGILGVGAIGAHAARVGKAFGMRVIGLRRSGEPTEDVEEMFVPARKLEFFAQCDVVMNTLPLTPATRGFMDEAAFAALPGGAIVINAGRGATIKTAALIDWAKSGRARAALLDVTDPEPLPPDHPLWETPGVFITPHYSGAHPDYVARANEIFLDNLGRFVRGEPLRNRVDVEAGY